MTPAIITLLALVFAAVNFVRGRGYFQSGFREIASLGFGISASIAAIAFGLPPMQCANVFLAVFLGTLLWLIPGWGIGFVAITGNVVSLLSTPANGIDEVISWLTERLYMPAGGTMVAPQARAYGLIWMSLRGLLLTPLFIALAVILNNPFVALLGLGGALQGPAYWIMRWLPNPGKYGVLCAEPLFGAVLGILTGLAVNFGQ